MSPVLTLWHVTQVRPLPPNSPRIKRRLPILTSLGLCCARIVAAAKRITPKHSSAVDLIQEFLRLICFTLSSLICDYDRVNPRCDRANPLGQDRTPMRT